MKAKITNRRLPKTRKKWYEISVRFINGETKEVAKFTYEGDVSLYVTNLQAGNTIEEIFID